MEELLGRGAPVLHRNLHCLTISVFRPDVEIVLNDDSTIGQMAPGYASELEDQKQEARELVERIAKELRSAGFKVDTAVEIGDIRERIIDSAADWHADLIVLGSHGRRGIQRFLLGSVAEFVARHANCSVEIVRTPVRI